MANNFVSSSWTIDASRPRGVAGGYFMFAGKPGFWILSQFLIRGTPFSHSTGRYAAMNLKSGAIGVRISESASPPGLLRPFCLPCGCQNCPASQEGRAPKGRRGARPREHNAGRIHGQHKRFEKGENHSCVCPPALRATSLARRRCCHALPFAVRWPLWPRFCAARLPPAWRDCFYSFRLCPRHPFGAVAGRVWMKEMKKL